ncbi:MAG: DedA family protein [Bacteroidales bacterium]|nr:DedA family protein [Bacteroidales bacterium]
MYHLNYFSISVLMTIESSFIPFPSEVVIPPAAYAACNPENQSLYVTDYKLLNVFLVVLFGTLGALIGAFINYFLALYLGRPIIYKFADSKLGHLLLLDSSKIKKAEDYFVKHGNSSTFIGRLLPGIRQLISIPAGLAKMKLTPFITYTCLGAGIWNSMLAVLGYIAHGEQDIINKYSHELSYVLLGLGVILLVYLIIKGLKKKNKKKID